MGVHDVLWLRIWASSEHKGYVMLMIMKVMTLISKLYGELALGRNSNHVLCTRLPFEITKSK
jgi:hypothetical protein